MQSNVFSMSGFVHNNKSNRHVLVLDPRKKHWAFKDAVLCKEISVRKIGAVVAEHTVELGNGVQMTCPPSWVSAAHAEQQTRSYQPFSLMGAVS